MKYDTVQCMVCGMVMRLDRVKYHLKTWGHGDYETYHASARQRERGATASQSDEPSVFAGHKWTAYALQELINWYAEMEESPSKSALLWVIREAQVIADNYKLTKVDDGAVVLAWKSWRRERAEGAINVPE